MTEQLPLHIRLHGLAAKLQMLWGNNPDADLVLEAVAALEPSKEEPAPEAEAPKTTRKKKATKK